MRIKEIFCIIFFGITTLIFTGFAVKVDKFAYASLNGEKVDIPLVNFKKLKLKDKKDPFEYYEDRNKKIVKIKNIKYVEIPRDEPNLPRIEYVRLILDLDDEEKKKKHLEERIRLRGQDQEQPEKPEETKIIKYFVETKSFWANFFC